MRNLKIGGLLTIGMIVLLIGSAIFLSGLPFLAGIIVICGLVCLTVAAIMVEDEPFSLEASSEALEWTGLITFLAGVAIFFLGLPFLAGIIVICGLVCSTVGAIITTGENPTIHAVILGVSTSVTIIVLMGVLAYLATLL